MPKDSKPPTFPAVAPRPPNAIASDPTTHLIAAEKRAIPKPVPKPLTANPEALLAISETDSFKKFSQLKVVNGKDKFTAMSRRHLVAALGDQGDDIQQEIEQLWQQCNDAEGKQIAYGRTLFDYILRWHLRGLTLKAAIRKVRVDREIRRRFHAGRRAAAQAEEIAAAFAIFTESGV